ncbi:MAG TPA: phosphopantetheine-binding protein [Verrucomicrobiales bacterium]|jgi:acyl carrier protein|nr:phosphopantetheine-binding protein [Verrucomicrobiales bacterium]
MKKSDFLLQLDNIIEAPPGSLKGTEKLTDISAWDSLAVLGFIAMVDEKFKVQLAGKDIAACETVADIAGLLGDRITP